MGDFFNIYILSPLLIMLKLLKKYWLWLLIGLIVIGVALLLLWKNRSNSDNASTLIYYAFEIIGGIGTLYAVIIALFNNDLQKFYSRPIIEIDLTPSSLGSDRQPQGQRLHVNKYFRDLIVKNTGESQAAECELYIENIRHGNRILREDENIKWSNAIERTFIPAGGHRVVNFIELKLAPNYMQIDEANPNPPISRGELYVNSIKIPEEWLDSEVEVNVAVYSVSTTEPIRKTINISYNGRWSADIDEMAQNITIL